MSVIVVAEIGSNWNPSNPLGSCQGMIQVAADAGADAVKFQDWHPIEEMQRSDEWKERCRPWTLKPEWHKPLQSYADESGVEFLCSVFTSDAVIRTVKMMARARGLGLAHQDGVIKLASSEITNQKLLRLLYDRNSQVWCSHPPRDILLSLGEASSAFAISTAIARLAAYNIILLACVAEYPVRRSLDLLDSLTFAQQFGLPVGISSHIAYPGVLSIARAAVKRGARVVEAHLRVKGITPEDAPDNGAWSLYPDEFKGLVDAVREAERVE